MELRETGRTEKKKRNETSIERRRRATRERDTVARGALPPRSHLHRRQPVVVHHVHSRAVLDEQLDDLAGAAAVHRARRRLQRRAMQRRVLVVVHGADVGSREQELVHRARVPEATRDQQRGDPASVHVRAAVDERVEQPAVPLPGRVEQRAASELIGRVNVRARAEERVDDGAVRVAAGVARVDVRARGEERVDDHRAAVLRREHERGASALVFVSRVDVGFAAREYTLDFDEMPERGGVDERGVFGAAPGLGGGGDVGRGSIVRRVVAFRVGRDGRTRHRADASSWSESVFARADATSERCSRSRRSRFAVSSRWAPCSVETEPPVDAGVEIRPPL
eukprot:31275-Pelagococcus_subviridis.AAC.9